MPKNVPSDVRCMLFKMLSAYDEEKSRFQRYEMEKMQALEKMSVLVENEDHAAPWTTTERQDLMRKYYPRLVEEYEESIKKPVKEKKPRGKNKNDGVELEKPKRKYNKKIKKLIDPEIENLSSSINNLNINTKTSDLNTSKANVSVKVNKLKRKIKSAKSKNQKTIDSLVQNKRRKSKILMNSLRRSFKDIMCENDVEFDIINDNNYDQDDGEINKENEDNNAINKHSMSIFNISHDEIDEFDLSDIVDKIVNKAPVSKTATVNNNLVKLVFKRKMSTPRKSWFRKSVINDIVHKNCSTPRESPVRRKSFNSQANISNYSFRSKVETSYFFDKLTDDCDAFELSVDCKEEINLISDSDTTVNYSLGNTSLL